MRSFCLAMLVGLALGPGLVWAGTPANGSQAVNASTVNSCRIQNTTDVAFGAYDPTSSAGSTGVGQVILRCTKAAAYTVASNSGQNGGAMRSGQGDKLSYALYSDAGYSKLFAAGAAPQGYDAGKAYQCFGSATSATAPSSGIYAYNNSQYLVSFLGSAASVNACTSTYTGTKYIFQTTTTTYANGAQPPAGTTQYIYLPPTNTGISGTSASGLSPITLALYGKVAGSQDVRPGAFTDVVTVTVSF